VRALDRACRYLSITTEQDEKQAALSIKAALGVVGLCLIGTYVASSVGGAGVKLASAAVAIFGVMMLGTIAVIGGAIGFHTLGDKLRGKAGGMTFSPFVVSFAQAALFFWGMFFYVGFLLLSMLNQLFRRLCPCGLLKRFDTDEERRSVFTLRAQNSLKTLRTWKWTSVLIITDYLAIMAWCALPKAPCYSCGSEPGEEGLTRIRPWQVVKVAAAADLHFLRVADHAAFFAAVPCGRCHLRHDRRGHVHDPRRPRACGLPRFWRAADANPRG
jgi:hypothetical protein|tara:strand:- start:373 stop:1188 length:816 start_codon:yes stop_codon:yes gene_type:complete